MEKVFPKISEPKPGAYRAIKQPLELMTYNQVCTLQIKFVVFFVAYYAISACSYLSLRLG